MSNLIHIPSPLTPVQTPKSHDLPHNTIGVSPFQYIPNSHVLKIVSLVPNSIKNGHVRAVSNYREGYVQDLDSLPVSVELEAVLSETQFDRIIAEAQQVEESVVIVWMASWCRKCIYLKPKLEKLAAEFYHRIRFYCIDVNNVPHKLVVRAGVTKMPTIQLWKDSKKQAEVIGGHKAYLVVNEVREMIENEYTV